MKLSERYSEDIDLVQIQARNIGEIMGAIKAVVNPILGSPKWKLSEGRLLCFISFSQRDIQKPRLN